MGAILTGRAPSRFGMLGGHTSGRIAQLTVFDDRRDQLPDPATSNLAKRRPATLGTGRVRVPRHAGHRGHLFRSELAEAARRSSQQLDHTQLVSRTAPRLDTPSLAVIATLLVIVRLLALQL